MQKAKTNFLYIDACLNHKIERPPVWLMRQAGRYMESYQKIRRQHDFKTCIYSPNLVKKITLLPINELNPDAAILFSDILTIIDAIGLNLVFKEKVGPIVTNPIQEPDDVQSLCLKHEKDIFTPIMEGVQACKTALNVYQKPLIGFSGAPFTLAAYLIEGQAVGNLLKTKQFIYQHPEAFQTLIDKLTTIITSYLKQQVLAGADALQIFDTWAGLLSYEHRQKYCIHPLQKIISSIKRETSTPISVFSKNASLFCHDFIPCQPDVIAVDWQADLFELKKTLPETITLQGNFDPILLFAPKAVIKEAALTFLNKAKNKKGIIANLGHGLLPNTPYENVKYFVDIFTQYTE